MRKSDGMIDDYVVCVIYRCRLVIEYVFIF
jgi:hypothetical protein